MIYEVYIQWFSEQPESIRRICSHIATNRGIYFDGKKFKAIKTK